MVAKEPNHISLSTGILTLPNELLTEIASHLSIPNLRILARVNCKLRFFVQDYLIRYQYTSVFWALPNEIIYEILRHLPRQKYCSHFAQSCWKLYPVIMDHVARQDVRHRGSSLLNYAAKRNLKAMARRMLRAGADIETRCGLPWNLSITPLGIAAHYGHMDMVELLLEAGASQVMDGSRIPLVFAMRGRHERVAILLSQDLGASTKPLGRRGGTVLEMASELKLPYLVRHYLGQGELQIQPHLDVESLHNLSAALLRVLLVDYNDGDFLKKTLDDDACKVVWMLWQHGASPDIRIQYPSPYVFTARAIASRHPDPRIRNLLSANMSSATLIRTCPIIGRPWMASQGQRAVIAFKPPPTQSLLTTTGPTYLTRISQRLKMKGIASMTVKNILSSLCYQELALNASDVAEVVRIENGKPRKHIKLDSLELSFELLFPQLACPNTHAQNVASEFWANKPAMDFSTVDESLDFYARDTYNGSRNAKPMAKPVPTEPFPLLAQVNPNPNDTAKDIWASFSERKVRQPANEMHEAPSNEGQDEGKGSFNKHLKRKKWRPLLL